MRYHPDLSVVTSRWPIILAGVQLTLYVAVVAMAVALVLGLVVFLRRDA